LAVKAGLNKAFGDAWRRFNPVKGIASVTENHIAGRRV
jgi:hypothetical protein